MSGRAANFGHPVWIRQRELRQRLSIGHSDTFYKGLYSSILPCNYWEEGNYSSNGVPGTVYSLAFSPDGSLLVAGCRRSCILVFDPLLRKKIGALNNPHMGCVFNVKFLDSWTLASGSEDCTVAFWDVRNLKRRVRSLFGHLWSVKNIEYSSQNDILVSTAVDGTSLIWNLKNETGIICAKEFGAPGFCRIRLHPDASKMIISSTQGYLIIVHNVDLNTISEDLAGHFAPFWDFGQSPSLRSRSRNRNGVEPVVDFPHAERCSVVTALGSTLRAAVR
ncbi:hypothetical protein R5R35_011676 [Gryllus longicercus]|uniref:Uncharacterized protein n=1 Tax=Gryllus longicercus TaxID=2509291 RepID=A0AAN9VPU8_9ORTH